MLQKTLSDADVLLQSYRSYYLIYNEFPLDTDGDYINEDVAPFLPSNLFKKTKTSNTPSESYTYTSAIKPFNDSNLFWDFNNWITWGSGGCMYISLGFSSGEDPRIDPYLNVFLRHYSLLSLQPFYGRAQCINIPFCEFHPTSKLDSVSKNRYY